MMRPPVSLPQEPFTRQNALSLGLTDHYLDELVRGGEVRRVLRAVYVRADVPDDQGARLKAAHLVLTRVVVACDRTAAWIWGVDTFEYRELEILPPLETYALRHHTRTRHPSCYGGVRDLLPQDVLLVDGLRVTTPLRTAIDLACKLSPRGGLAALDGFMRAFGITQEEMRRLLVRYYRRRGVVQARALVPWADPRSESPGESWTRCEILQRGIPAPELQWWVTEGGRQIYRLDMAWPKSRVAVEYDGREFHDDDEHKAHDEERREWLRRRGWIIIVVTKADLDAESVDRWIDELRVALRLR